MRGPMGGLIPRLNCAHSLREPAIRRVGGRPQRGERVATETLDQSPGEGGAGIAVVLRRAARDGPAWAAHPGPDHRSRPSARAGVPVHGCAQAARGARGRRLRGRAARIPSFDTSSRPVRRRSGVHVARSDTAGLRGAAQSCIEGLALAGTHPFKKVFTGAVRRTVKSAGLHS